MSELIAVEGLTIDHDGLSLITGGLFTVVSLPDLKVKCENNKAYVTVLSFTFAGGSYPGFVDGSLSGTGTIASTAIKTKASNALVMRENDTGSMTCTGTLLGGGTGQVVGPVIISVAGQTKVKAE